MKHIVPFCYPSFAMPRSFLVKKAEKTTACLETGQAESESVTSFENVSNRGKGKLSLRISSLCNYLPVEKHLI